MSVSEKEILAKLKQCYDPEIPCNIVDLGLVYDVRIAPIEGSDEERVDVKMTLTTQGCPMAGRITAEVQQKLLAVTGVGEANVNIVFDPPWTASQITEAGKKALGLV